MTGRRGGNWEERLILWHDQYRKDEEAWIGRGNPGVKQVRNRVLWAKQGIPDFVGVIDGGRAVAFEAKGAQAKTGWGFHLLEVHQARDLQAMHDRGGLAFIALRLPTGEYILPWSTFGEVWWAWSVSRVKASPGVKATPIPKVRGDHAMLVPMRHDGWLSWAVETPR